MLEYDWENSVGHWVCSTSHALRKAVGAALQKEGITLRQWEVLAWLSCNEGCGSQSELADAMGIEPHTLAGVLSRMERDGLLQRKVCQLDRRKNRIESTGKAEAMWVRVTEICHDLRNKAVEGFSGEELEMLRIACEKIRNNLSSDDLVAAGAPAVFNSTIRTDD
ncbi:MarR family winged helix-turn-helix transcriptional regulator [Planctomicrobium sp. SH664]|uniref:MarR family winged helix-turn-helix transcriptional regulator n=1 Tax=Planctomicrobium sp. SH664 TaxID=3448125 RepID=UPI003F5C4186